MALEKLTKEKLNKMKKSKKGEVSGETILAFYENQILSQIKELEKTTDKEKQLFLLGMKIGATGVEKLLLKDSCLQGTPCSPIVLNEIVELFNKNDFLNAEYWHKEIKKILK